LGMLGWWAWRESGNRIYLAGFYSFMALGMLAKGPVAPFLAAIVVVVYAATVRELRLIVKTIWLPGVLMFCAVALPWYVVVQMRNPQFVREFIVDQNLARFSSNLYHHTEPFWYYPPVIALALTPWVIFVIAAFVQTVRSWRPGRRPQNAVEMDCKGQFSIFTGCWLIVTVLFFSISQSKLPGYILPAVPAGSLLLVEYLRQRLEQSENEPPAIWLVVLHALVAAAPIIPSLLIAYLITQHRLPGGRPMLVAIAFAFVLCAGIALTLVRKSGLRMLRFVTLIPVVLAIGAVLRLGSADLDQGYSARPLAREIASIETHRQLLAVYHVPRELEYGLTFYRNQLTFNYDWGNVPSQEHLLVAPENLQLEIAKLVAGRRVSYLGNYAPQHLDYFWVAAAGANPR
jgi:4-amino-4-deoxy-L-arabinose transferase-like glycosyltransferase